MARIKTTAIIAQQVSKLRDATKHGETLTLKNNPLKSGTPYWQLINQEGDLVQGALNKDELLDIAEQVGVKVIEEEFADG